MVTYGWTIEQTLDITLPQANMLFKQMSAVPGPAIVLSAIMKSIRGEKDADKTDAPDVIAENIPGGSKKFFAKLGIAMEDAGG